MACYKIEWKKSAQKELRKLPKEIISKIIQKVEALAQDQYPEGSRKLTDSKSTYRLFS
ncbi:MAG: type II toxin-antitoxin system RelE family toxin [Xenococcaceae cyanobacterium]